MLTNERRMDITVYSTRNESRADEIKFTRKQIVKQAWIAGDCKRENLVT